MPVPMSVSALSTALLAEEVIDHGPDRQAESSGLDLIQGVSVEVYARHQRRHLPRESDDGAREGAEFRDGNEYEHLADGAAQTQRHQQESHILTHPGEDVDLIENYETYSGEYRLAQLYIVHEIEGPDGVDGHELVLVSARATVEAEGDEEKSHANELGGRIFLVAVWFIG